MDALTLTPYLIIFILLVAMRVALPKDMSAKLAVFTLVLISIQAITEIRDSLYLDLVGVFLALTAALLILDKRFINRIGAFPFD